MSWGTDLEDRLVTMLNQKKDWSIPFTAKRVPFLSADLRQSLSLQVQVVCAKVEEKRLARGYWERRGTIQIALLWHTNDPLMTTDRLGTLAEEMSDFLVDRPLGTIPGRQTGLSRVAPLAGLQEQRICSLVLSVVYEEATNDFTGVQRTIPDT